MSYLKVYVASTLTRCRIL